MADFKLGRIKFKWRGDWAVDTAYLIDDVIKYGGNQYVCIQNHTSPNNQNIFYTSYTADCQDVDATGYVEPSAVAKSSVVKAVAPLLLFSLFTK